MSTSHDLRGNEWRVKGDAAKLQKEAKVAKCRQARVKKSPMHSENREFEGSKLPESFDKKCTQLTFLHTYSTGSICLLIYKIYFLETSFF